MMTRILVLLLPGTLALTLALAQSELAESVNEALRANPWVPVHDLGKLLKPRGAAELEQLARKFRGDNIHVHFVTVPKDSGNLQGLTVAVYRERKMGTDDLLILFNGKQVYGESLALKGEGQAFREAAQDALPTFKLYYAKGLAQFAQSLRDRILQRRAEAARAAAAERARKEQEQLAHARRLYGLLGFSGTLILGGVSWVTYRRWKLQAEEDRQFRARLAEAEALYQRIALRLPTEVSEEMRKEFLGLDRELNRHRQRKGARAASLDDLFARLRAFDQRLPQPFITHEAIDQALQPEPNQES